MDYKEAQAMKSDLELDTHPLPENLSREEVLKWIDDDIGVETACGQELLPPDNVEHAIREWISKVENSGYDDESSQMAVYDALAFLVENDIIEDTPLVEDEEEIKTKWIDLFNKKIYARLVAVGIDFSEG